jgi:acyl-coenzyme A synthetase/AMP-(fatty) acid ligase
MCSNPIGFAPDIQTAASERARKGETMLEQPVPTPDYETIRRTFQPTYEDQYNFARDVVDRWAEDPLKLALISVAPDGWHAQAHTFIDLKQASNRFAKALLRLGARKGDHALVMLPRVPEWYIAVLGMIKVGVVPMPATVLCTAKDVAYRLDKGEARFALTDSENAPKVDAAAHDAPTLLHRVVVGAVPGPGWRCFDELVREETSADPTVEPTFANDPLILFFTSGTAGYPKMVVHRHAPYVHGLLATAKYWHGLTEDDIHWAISDTGWAKMAYGKLFGQWMVGATVLQHNPAGRFDPGLALRVIERFGVTSFCAPPTAYRMLIREDLAAFDLTSLRRCTSAGEPLNPEVIKEWQAGTGLPIFEGYGQTETTLLAASLPCFPVRPGSMGRPMPGYDLAVVDGEGQPVAPGEEGEIAVRVSPVRPLGLFDGYWKDPEKTASCYRGDFYLTGDRAVEDEDGYLWFVGRADDVIKSSGYRIGPFEVESALLEHPAVLESGVVGSPDPVRGEVVKAFVVLRPGWEPSDALVADLQAHVRGVTAPYKYPRKIEFVEELPKTISGKILRRVLRERERGREGPAGGHRPAVRAAA